MRQPLSIYCDWALHDELGDDVRLTEEMTMGVLDTLGRWKGEHGVGFDYYLIDCFWFEQPGDYTRFNPETWPNGFGPARRRMEELGMTPGLWLDTTGGRVAGRDEWADSLDVHDGASHCLFDGPYADDLEGAMLHAIEEWGIGMFKFDFANFHAVSTRRRGMERGEIYRRNVTALRRVCRRVRSKHPEVVMLAYNRFAYRDGYYSDTTGEIVPGIEPAWLDVMDYVYSGDPRPADAPCASLRRAVDMYQDHVVHKFHYSGLPLERIDDHGCMVGTTNTIYYLGERGWRRTWLQSLGRGGRKAHFYGDVGLLSDDDVRFLGRARELFFDLYRRGAPTRPVGGVPCQSPWHGFLTGSGSDGLLVVVNGTAEPLEIELPVDELQDARILFHDIGFEPRCTASWDELRVTLAGEQMALVGLGTKAEERFDLGANVGGDPVTGKVRELDLPFEGERETIRCLTSGAALAGPAEHTGMDGLRLSFRLRSRNAAYRGAVGREEVVADAMPINVKADGETVEEELLVPNVQVWSGCSWVTGIYPLEAIATAEQVEITFECPDAVPRIIPRAWLQRLPTEEVE
ncbi:MAG: hypothetical protein R6X33_09370 [Candidatus Brocadiia bacterium]